MTWQSHGIASDYRPKNDEKDGLAMTEERCLLSKNLENSQEISFHKRQIDFLAVFIKGRLLYEII